MPNKESQPLPKRKPSAYNLFMKDELKKMETENPTLTHKERFKLCAGKWKDRVGETSSII